MVNGSFANRECSYSIKVYLKLLYHFLVDFKELSWICLRIQGVMLNMSTNSRSCVEYVYEFKKICWICLRIQGVKLNMSKNSRSYVEYVYVFKESGWICLRIQVVKLNMSMYSRSYVEYVYVFNELSLRIQGVKLNVYELSKFRGTRQGWEFNEDLDPLKYDDPKV